MKGAKKKGLFVLGVMILLAAIVSIILIWTVNTNEVTVDLSEIKAGQIIAGTSTNEADFECSYNAFIQHSYDLVLVGFEKYDTDVTYMGMEDNQWYRAETKISYLGWLMEPREATIIDQNLIISYGKDIGSAVTLTLIAVVVGVALALLCFLESDESC